jgi:hypothetical protein
MFNGERPSPSRQYSPSSFSSWIASASRSPTFPPLFLVSSHLSLIHFAFRRSIYPLCSLFGLPVLNTLTSASLIVNLGQLYSFFSVQSTSPLNSIMSNIASSISQTAPLSHHTLTSCTKSQDHHEHADRYKAWDWTLISRHLNLSLLGFWYT